MAKVGRPLKFKTVEELQEKIDKYFKDCEKKEIPLTITGLALALDTDRQTLMNYEHKEDYFDTIKKAKLKIENAYEIRCINRGNGGDIFALKNFGWTDRQEIEQTVKVEKSAVEELISSIDELKDED